ncbi:MAG: elongation factor G [Labilithrix sp.]
MAAKIPLERIRNIGISAHIDSGKTTLTERVLFYTGRIHKIHEVRGKDGVGAKMDSMDLEREKGITIQSAATYCLWPGSQNQIEPININIIDTPGHVDFTIEVERALRVLDGAVLILDSGKGVQSQSITVDKQMKRYHVPRIAFVNKMDNPGANYEKGADMLASSVTWRAPPRSSCRWAEHEFKGIIDPILMKVFIEGNDGRGHQGSRDPAERQARSPRPAAHIIEKVADVEDTLAEKFLAEEPISIEEIRAAIRRATLSLKMTPVMCGSAVKNKGVQLLLDAVYYYLPNPTEVVNEAHDQDNNEAKVVVKNDPSGPFVGLAFKLQQDKYGQLTYFRLYSGRIAAGDTIFNTSNENRKVRVPRMFRMHSDDREEIQVAEAGDIVAFYGVEASSGETFTDGKVNYTLTSMHVPAAVISLAVAPKDRGAETNFSKALNRFTKEDPTFRVHQDEESQQTIISGMGELHLDIYMERMKREYNCEVVAGKPQVAYRESISKKAEINYTHKKQTGGSGQYAKVMGYIEPLPPDAVESYEFVDDVVGGSIPREFISSCDKGFKEAVKKGNLIGFPVVGIRCCVNDGASHAVDSSEMAFKTAAMMGFREAYEKAGATILEPIMKVEIDAPTEFQGAVVGQVNQRRGVIQETIAGDTVNVIAEVPLNAMFGYSTDLRSATQGKGTFTMEFAKYAVVPRQEQDEMIKAYKAKLAADAKK